VDSLGWWELEVGRAGPYRAAVRLPEAMPGAPSKVVLRVGGQQHVAAVRAGAEGPVFDLVLEAGPTRLEAWVECEDGGGALRTCGVWQVDVEGVE
jgi:hypothetical protein